MLKEIGEDFIKLVNEPLDPSLIRKNYGGEKYITGYTVVRLLNKLTNGAWDFTIDKTWAEKCKDKKGEHDIYHMDLTLRCIFDDGKGGKIELKKTGTAGKELSSSAKNAENIYKSLETLALRKAASYFGIGAELWLNEDENDWFEQASAEPVWTEELLAQYNDTWEAISEIQTNYDLTDEDMDGIVQSWNGKYNELGEVLPEDIDKLLSFLKEQLEIDNAGDDEKGEA